MKTADGGLAQSTDGLAEEEARNVQKALACVSAKPMSVHGAGGAIPVGKKATPGVIQKPGQYTHSSQWHAQN